MEDRKKSLPSQKAAERIKKIFTKENQIFFYTLTKQFTSHHYDLMLVPKVPSQSRRLSFYGNQLKSFPKKQRNWNPRQNEQKQSLSLKGDLFELKELNPHRVKLCKLKEHYLASRKLKSIAIQKNHTQNIKNQVSLLENRNSSPFEKDHRMEYWEEFIKNREERHFNIDRIIKYLSD